MNSQVRAGKGMLIILAQLSILMSVSCGNVEPRSEFSGQELRLKGVEFIPKRPDFGGEACVAMFLRASGLNVDQDFVFDHSGVDPLLGRGCFAAELSNAVKQIGVDPGPVWIAVDRAAQKEQFTQEVENLKTDIGKGVPWVVCLNRNGTQQFVLVLGFDPVGDKVIFHDPNSASGQYVSLPSATFRKQWALSSENGDAFYVKLRMAKSRELKGESSATFTDADYAQHIRKLKLKIPEGDFKIVIQKPFVVIGDEDERKVRQRAESTVGWAAKRLKERYFDKDPNEILDVWLFKDKDSYNTHAMQLFGKKPTTPFGYYSSYHRSLVMNISTGGGTLVHEIVHPFIESNFTDCPSWFNEGLASLYEQCRDNDGTIWGSTNWRLRGLQLAIEDDRVPSFKELCSTTRDEFYNQDRGTNYAQARYLCYYLQEHGKLVRFYETFRDNVGSDPTGLASLKAVLGTDDLRQFQVEWQRYVAKLRF